MSLTSQLRDPTSPIHQYLGAHFANAQAVSARWRAELAKVETALPPAAPDHGYPYGTVGTALNWYLELAFGDVSLRVAEAGYRSWRELAFGQHPVVQVGESLCPDPLWLDQTTGETLTGPPDGYGLFHLLQRAIDDFVRDWGPMRPPLDSDRLEHLCRYCWALALFEQVVRAGPVVLKGPLGRLQPLSGVGALLELAPEVGVADCCQLAEIAQEPLLAAFGHLPQARRHLDPMFAGSGDVGGADADFILGDCLVDCKTAIRPIPGPAKLRDSWLWQLVGYAALDYDDTYGIERAATYLARQGRLVVWRLSELLGLLSDGHCSSIGQVRSDLKSVLGRGPARH